MELPTISYVTYTWQLPLPVAYRPQIDRVRKLAESKGVDFTRTFASGVPMILDAIIEQLDKLPDNNEAAPATTPIHRGGRRRQQSNSVSRSEHSSLADLVPPATINPTGLINGNDDTDRNT